ncbi:hypothetical protein HK096_002866, partial [Nowakowskiella sp. JEL0078]
SWLLLWETPKRSRTKTEPNGRNKRAPDKRAPDCGETNVTLAKRPSPKHFKVSGGGRICATTVSHSTPTNQQPHPALPRRSEHPDFSFVCPQVPVSDDWIPSFPSTPAFSSLFLRSQMNSLPKPNHFYSSSWSSDSHLCMCLISIAFLIFHP